MYSPCCSTKIALSKVTRDFLLLLNPVISSCPHFAWSLSCINTVNHSFLRETLPSLGLPRYTDCPGFLLILLHWFFFLTLDDPGRSPWTSSLAPLCHFPSLVVLNTIWTLDLNFYLYPRPRPWALYLYLQLPTCHLHLYVQIWTLTSPQAEPDPTVLRISLKGSLILPVAWLKVENFGVIPVVLSFSYNHIQSISKSYWLYFPNTDS